MRGLLTAEQAMASESRERGPSPAREIKASPLKREGGEVGVDLGGVRRGRIGSEYDQNT